MPTDRGGDGSAALAGAALALARLGAEDLRLGPLGARVDAILSGVMRLPNLFIALIDDQEHRIRFVYTRDRHDRHVDRPLDGLGLSDQVYLRARSLLLRRSEANALLAAGELVNHGVPSQVWLGVPLIVRGRVVAVMATQDYEDEAGLGAGDEARMNLLAPVVAGLVERSAELDRDQGEAERGVQRRREREVLFATLGHEVRSPLSVIVGYADLLRRQLSGSEPGLTAQRVFEAAQELSEASTRLLDYAVFAAGAYREESRPVELGGWMRSLESWMLTRGEQADRRVEIEMTAGLGERARVQGNLLRQLLQHVLRVAFAVPDATRVRLRLRVQPVVMLPAGRLRLAFGIDARRAAGSVGGAGTNSPLLRVEEDAAGRTLDAMGVGLAMAVRLAELLGAELRVSERDTLPWRASLVLTVSAAESDRADQGTLVEAAQRVLRDQLSDRSRQVIVCDGDPVSCAALGAIVREVTGADPVAVASATELASCIARNPVGVVIAGIERGPEQVREAALALTNGGGGRPSPCLIAVSSHQEPDLVEAMLDGGADAYVPQPLSRAALLVALTDAWLEYERRVELLGG